MMVETPGTAFRIIRTSLIALLMCGAGGVACSQDIQLFEGHAGAVTMGKWTPDGRLIVTSGTDTTARVWHAADGKELRRYEQHTGPVYCLDVSADGRMLATGAQDNTVRIWDLPASAPLTTTKVSSKPVTSIALSPDGRKLLVTAEDGLTEMSTVSLPAVSGAADGDAAVSNAADSGQSEQNPVPRGPAGTSFSCAAWRSDGAFFVAGDASGRIRLWSPFLQPAQLDFAAHECPIAGVWFYSTNATLVSAGADGEFKVWQLANALAGKPAAADEPAAADKPAAAATPTLQRAFKPHDKPLVDASAYNNGVQIITVSDDRRVMMNDVNSGAVVREFPTGSHTCRCLAARRDNQRLAGGMVEGKVLIWNAGNAQLLQTLEVDAPVTHLAWSSDNRKLAVVDQQNRVHLFGPSLPNEPRQELVPHQSFAAAFGVTDLQFSLDSRAIWLAHNNGTIAEWPYASPIQVRQLNHGGAVFGIAITSDGRSVVTCGADQTVRVWDTATGQQRFQMRGHQGAVHAIALNQDDTIAVSTGADGTIRLWDIVGGRQLKQLTRFDATMYAVSMHRNGKHLITGGADRRIRVLDIVTGDTLRTMEGHTDYIHSVSSDQSGTRLLSYGYGGHLKTWDFDTGSELTSERIGRIGNFARFSPDGTRVLLTNGDGFARIVSSP